MGYNNKRNLFIVACRNRRRSVPKAPCSLSLLLFVLSLPVATKNGRPHASAIFPRPPPEPTEFPFRCVSHICPHCCASSPRPFAEPLQAFIKCHTANFPSLLGVFQPPKKHNGTCRVWRFHFVVRWPDIFSVFVSRSRTSC